MNKLSLRIGVVRACVLAMLLVGVSASAKLADEELALLKTAFEQMINTQNESCAYTETVHKHETLEEEVDTTTVARFDPFLRPESPWEVLSVDGRAPTERETMQFEPSEFGHPTMNFKPSNDGDPSETQEGGTDMTDLPAEMEDMEVVSKEDDIWIFEVAISDMPQPPDESIEGFPKKIKMKMHIEVHAPTSTLRAYRIFLSKPLRFMLVVRISKLEFAMIFGSDPNLDGLVMKEMNMEMTGRALWKRISTKQRTIFTDFVCSDRSLTSDDQSQASSLN